MAIAKELIVNGAYIVTDTNMAFSGINKKALSRFGGEVHCYMADETVCKTGKGKGLYQSHREYGDGI